MYPRAGCCVVCRLQHRGRNTCICFLACVPERCLALPSHCCQPHTWPIKPRSPGRRASDGFFALGHDFQLFPLIGSAAGEKGRCRGVAARPPKSASTK
ncbi:hypothetical protein E2C01_090785 [Portunus trituberculatus]|uniref:Uncharacterized protein n=1 Tax=Portunus trituberculatus TaxID=210409 RepID=A0A5B7JR26_PORTR|nr:hypothetical protein [Portunus trituberculatus]